MPNSVNENSTITLKEKPLEGASNYALRLIQLIQPGVEKNNLRLLLVRGQKIRAVFGGTVAFDIRPDEHQYYFEQIKTLGQFIEFSKRIRKKIVDTLKA